MRISFFFSYYFFVVNRVNLVIKSRSLEEKKERFKEKNEKTKKNKKSYQYYLNGEKEMGSDKLTKPTAFTSKQNN